MRVNYRYVPPTTVFYARGVGPYARSCPEAWATLDAWLEKTAGRRRVRQAFGLFHDNPRSTAADLIRYDACVPLISCTDLEPCAGVGRQILAGGAWTVHTHVGSYEESSELFSRLHGELVPKRGLVVDYGRPFMAVYLNDPHQTRTVHGRTELCIPVLPIPMPIASNDASKLDLTAIARRLAG